MTIPAALHPFLLLAKSAAGAACADIIKQATSSPGIYTFTALLEAENIKKLAGTDHEKSLELLKLFSWGTYQQYKKEAQNLPPLNELQVDKLRRLTLVTLASESHDLPYATIMEALDITETRELEDLCINTIYSSLLTGKLSPQTQIFEISSVTARDLGPSHDYASMIDTLSKWSNQCDLVLAEISGRIRDIRNTEKVRKDEELAFQKEVEKMRKPEEGETEMGKGKGKEKEKEKGFWGMGDEAEAGGGRILEDVGDDAWESPMRRKRKSPGGS